MAYARLKHQNYTYFRTEHLMATRGRPAKILTTTDLVELEKFLADSGHQPLQEKFDQVFPPTAAPRFTSMPGSDIANDFNDEGLAMSDDKELDLIQAHQKLILILRYK